MNMPTFCRIKQLEKCDPTMFGDLVVTCQTPVDIQGVTSEPAVLPVNYTIAMRRSSAADAISEFRPSIFDQERRRASALVDELLMDIYYTIHNGTTDYNSTSGRSYKGSFLDVVNIREKDVPELVSIIACFRNYIERIGSILVRQLKRRDALRRQQEAFCDVITRQLFLRAPQSSSTNMRFAIQPLPGDTGFSQWVAAMKMVAQLPGGIPSEFRKRLWLTMADRHLAAKGVDWPEVERNCFSEWSHPADAELGVQIVKDLHRTGCSLFCGENGQENQALLKRVLLAYARWNKAVGYCQGFNMLAALILQVTEKCESDALKLMIYLIEGVLPDSYFADSLRGLSVDMAVFRELLRSRLPKLSKHLDLLQNAAKDGTRSYEPPLTNVFTMQWFLTLFCNCLPQPTVLRVWDLILLEGNEILLRTALAIWQVLATRITTVRTADEFYCLMGVLTRELLEFDLVDANSLIKAVVAIGPLTELATLREHYLYNINPWGTAITQAVDKQVKLYSKQSIALDIGALKKQYTKLKQRQRQAHIIFSAAITRQPPPAPPVTMNHLLLGKSALVPAKRLGPPPGAIPPPQKPPATLHWKDTPKQQSSSSSSSDTELCDDDSDAHSDVEETGKANSQITKDNPVQVFERLAEVTGDNTIQSVTISASAEEDNNSLMTDSITNIKSESDDDNFDFEQFLVDRVKCLRELDEQNAAEEKINFARRNSQKALQIIQENSLILQRIMQCQSRLSPPPSNIENQIQEDICASLDKSPEELLSPSTISLLPQITSLDTSRFDTEVDGSICLDRWNDEKNEGDLDFNFVNQSELSPIYPSSLNFTSIYPQEMKDSYKDQTAELQISPSSLITDPVLSTAHLKIKLTPASTEVTQNEADAVSPVYGSRYTNILEKSKSLDERYNALILGKQPYGKQNFGNSDVLQTSFSWALSSTSSRDVEVQDISPKGIKESFIEHSSKNIDLILDTVESNNSCLPEGKYAISDFPECEDLSYSPRRINCDVSPNYTFKANTPDAGEFETPISLDNNIFDYKFESTLSQNSTLFPSTENNEFSRNPIEIEHKTAGTDKSPDKKQPTCESDVYSTNFEDQFSPFVSKEYKLPTPEFERFYTISESFINKDDIISPLDFNSKIGEYKSDAQPTYTESSPNVSTSKALSYLDYEFQYKDRTMYPEETIRTTDSSTLNDTRSKEFSSTQFSSSSQTCYSYLSDPRNDSFCITQEKSQDSQKQSPVHDAESDYVTAKKKSFTLDLSSPRSSISPLISPLKPLKSPARSPLKSPAKGFNPFPVQNNSRQNKEVLLKLGLYKK